MELVGSPAGPHVSGPMSRKRQGRILEAHAMFLLPSFFYSVFGTIVLLPFGEAGSFAPLPDKDSRIKDTTHQS